MFDDDEDDELELAEAIIYKPCKMCESNTYDMGDCDLIETEEGLIYQPGVCDDCYLNGRSPLLVIH